MVRPKPHAIGGRTRGRKRCALVGSHDVCGRRVVVGSAIAILGVAVFAVTRLIVFKQNKNKMAKRNTKSYSKFNYDDLKALGLRTVLVDLFATETIKSVASSSRLQQELEEGQEFSLATEKARSEFIIAPGGWR